MRAEEAEVRRSRRLVISFIATVANYEYGFYWNLYQDGTIEFDGRLTGILSTGAVGPDVKPKHGQLLNREGLYAPIHQHYMNFRLDLDVDGRNNKIYEVHTEAVPPGDENPQDRKSTRLNSSHANISYAVFCLKKNHSSPIL